jgi:hypothetical protein
MNGMLKFPPHGVFGTQIVWLGRLESAIIYAVYGPDPGVMKPVVLENPAPVLLGGNWLV